jgi:PAT family beta-lactamase induction signal transducer AmpG
MLLGALSAALLVAAGIAGPHGPIVPADAAVASDAGWLERQAAALGELSRGGLWGFALIVFALSLASASLDVVVDAFRTDSVSRAQLGRAASVFVACFRIASLVGGAGALLVAARLGWQAAFIVAAVVMGVATISVAFAPEPHDGEPASFLDAVLGPLRTFARQWGITAIALAAFVLMFRLPDLVGNRMVGPFLIQELGFTLDEIAWIRQFLGFGFTIVGAALGGVVISRLGIARSMLLFGVLQAASNLGWVWLDHAGKDRGVLLAAVAVENACNGMVGTVFVAFLMSLCDHRYSAAQYAILTGLMFLASSLVGAFSGSLLDECQRLPGMLGGYSGFFIATIAMGVPGIAMVPWITRKAAARPGAA